MSTGPLLGGKIRLLFERLIDPMIGLLGRLNLSPDAVTVTGLFLSSLAGFAFAKGLFFEASLTVSAAGICDALDGKLARHSRKTSLFGAFLDSTLDRIGETFIFLGVVWFFSQGTIEAKPCPWTVVLTVMALSGSLLVSYTRARAEALGVECKEGLFQRPERMLVIIIGSLLASVPQLGSIALKISLFVLALFTNITVIERILNTRRRFLDKDSPLK